MGGTPENIGSLDEVSLLNFVTKYLSCRYDFNSEKYPRDRIIFFFVLYRSPGCVVKMAVSSANMLNIILLDVGRSAVYILYNTGPKMLPWGDTREHWEFGRSFVVEFRNEVPVL